MKLYNKSAEVRNKSNQINKQSKQQGNKKWQHSTCTVGTSERGRGVGGSLSDITKLVNCYSFEGKVPDHVIHEQKL